MSPEQREECYLHRKMLGLGKSYSREYLLSMDFGGHQTYQSYPSMTPRKTHRHIAMLVRYQNYGME